MRQPTWRVAVVVCIATIALTPASMAQDMTGGMVTDPPAPVANDVATFTATYENLGPGPAANIYVSVLVPIQPQTFPMESPGFLAMVGSAIDSNGNEVAHGFDWDDTCNYYLFRLQDPNPPDPANPYTIPNPFPAGHEGSFRWAMPVIPMEGINAGRVIITEPESLRNSYSDASVQRVGPDDSIMGHAGLYNLVSLGGNCSAVLTGCVDLESCFGHRLLATDPFEADLEVVAGDNVGFPPETDPALGCGSGLVGFTAGRIALLRRGTCTFLDKLRNAQNAGASGAIIANSGLCGTLVNYDPDECTFTQNADVPTTAGQIDIPWVMMSRRQGEELIAAAQGGQTAHAKMGNLPGDHLDLFNRISQQPSDPDPFNNYLVTRVPISLFSDGFESGDTSAWSATVP